MGAEGHFLNKAERNDLTSYLRKEYERSSNIKAVLEIAKRGSVFYLLTERVGGEVTISVVTTHKRRASKFQYESEVIFKFMDETCHPYYYDAPLKWLDRVTPTDSENANTYRAALRQHADGKAERRKAGPVVKTGFFKLGFPVGLRIGGEYDIVFIPEVEKGTKPYFWPVSERETDGCHINPVTMEYYFQAPGVNPEETVFRRNTNLPVKLGRTFFSRFEPKPIELTPLTEVPSTSAYYAKSTLLNA